MRCVRTKFKGENLIKFLFIICSIADVLLVCLSVYREYLLHDLISYKFGNPDFTGVFLIKVNPVNVLQMLSKFSASSATEDQGLISASSATEDQGLISASSAT